MGETFKQRERWDGTAGLAAGNAGLGHPGSLRDLALGQADPRVASPSPLHASQHGSKGQPKNVGASGYRAPSWIQGLLQAAAGTSDPVDATVVLLAQAGDRIVTGDAGDLPRLAAAAGTGCVLVAC